ncbi:unnamed protein product, partial [Rotaria sp. Silwood2]
GKHDGEGECDTETEYDEEELRASFKVNRRYFSLK